MTENNLNCTLTIPSVEGLQEQQITVGRHFYFNCKGEWNKDFQLQQAQLVIPENQKYQLVLKKVEARSPQEIDIDVVSYMTGQWQFPELLLTDGQQQIKINQIQFQVDSVIQSPVGNQTGQQASTPEPYGFQVAKLDWPIIYSIGFFIFITVFFALVIRSLLKSQSIRRKYANIKNYESALNPESQFYKSVRTLEKKDDQVFELSQIVRLYITRRYQIPAIEMSTKEALQQFSNKWPRLKDEKKEVKNILNDLDRMMNDKEKKQDLKEYIPRLYRFVDHTEIKMQDRSL